VVVHAPGHARSIGKGGTAVRVVVGIAFLYLGAVGLPPINLLPWWQILIGLVGVPAVIAAAQLIRSAFNPQPFNETGPLAAAANFVVFIALTIYEPTRGATLVFLGASMLFAGVRGVGDCEVIAISNWILRRDDHLGCPLFWPVDRAETATRTSELQSR